MIFNNSKLPEQMKASNPGSIKFSFSMRRFSFMIFISLNGLFRLQNGQKPSGKYICIQYFAMIVQWFFSKKKQAKQKLMSDFVGTY